MKSSKKKLARAVVLAMGGAAVALGAMESASAATTMYNMYHSSSTPYQLNTTPFGSTWTGAGFTDGWNTTSAHSCVNAGTCPSGPGNWANSESPNNGTPNAKPFGYTSDRTLHWGAHLTQANDTAEISQQDAFNRYGKYADIDAAGGAWFDNGTAPKGWVHDLDIGLIKSDVTQQVTLSVHGVGLTGTHYGFSVFQGMETAVGGYSHHGAWNDYAAFSANPQDIGSLAPFTHPNLGTAIAHSNALDANTMDTITFTAQAGQVYTVFLGGYRDSAWGATNDGYVLNITTSAVPLPAAAWLFAPAIAGLFGFGRRKTQAATA